MFLKKSFFSFRSLVNLVESKTSSKLEVLYQLLSRLLASLDFRKRQENPGLPDDLVEEIMVRVLEVKPLLRFKSVSKEWKSMIESGYLAEKHLRLRQKRYGAEEMKVTFKPFKPFKPEGFHMQFIEKHHGFGKADKLEPEKDVRVAGSCNGLFCVCDLVNVYLINPSTKVMRRVAPPSGNILSVGFGRDIVTGTYKVVVMYSLEMKDISEAVVFDLDTSQWRWSYQTAGPLPLAITLINREKNPVFVKGSLFWLLTSDQILVMDLHTEKFHTMSKPEVTKPDRIYIWSQEDRVCVSDLSDVWSLVQDKVSEKWIRTAFRPISIIPPLLLNSAWLSKTLISPYQSSSSETYNFSLL